MDIITTAISDSSQLQSQINAIIACDVSKNTINLVAKLGKHLFERQFDNRTKIIEKELQYIKTVAKKCNCNKALVVCEPTGNYHNTLLRTAKRLDLETAYVSAEAVAKMRVIETNDSGKTDIKDPRVIHSLATIGKTIQHRLLDEPYNLLRQWNKMYDAADKGVVKKKGAVHTIIKELFADFNMKKDFIFGNSGAALMANFGYNPYRIRRTGKKRFVSKMKKAVPRIKNTTLDKIFTQAICSTKNDLPRRYIQLLELELEQTWHDLSTYRRRKQQAKIAMEALYKEACQQDPKLPEAVKGVITTFHLARVVAETGPLSDFGHWRKLMRFAGLNLCERQSGKYRGKTKISKKGRRLLRKILGLIVLPLVKKTGLYGDYYHRKKLKMPGTRAIVSVARHFLKMLYGWYHSSGKFNAQRVFSCQSQFLLAA